ncbi:MAG: hypothetical protein K2L18_01965 [Acetatifactor sp.]|nr:hypothetical protein [Acetatifactor sp.]
MSLTRCREDFFHNPLFCCQYVALGEKDCYGAEGGRLRELLKQADEVCMKTRESGRSGEGDF